MLKRWRRTALWRHPDFLKFWAGQTVSLFGSHISILALPLTAVLILKATPFQMGVLTALGASPTLLFGLIAGVWVDRLHKRLILIVTDTGRFILLSLIPLAFLLGTLRMGMLYLLAFFVGTLTIFFNVAYRSYLPVLIEREQLVEWSPQSQASVLRGDRELVDYDGAIRELQFQGVGGRRDRRKDEVAQFINVLGLDGTCL